jgi:hypothetical protein
MRLATFIIGLLLFASWACAQPGSDAKQAITRARRLSISTLDGRLPKVSLEFFLNYEAQGLPVTLNVVDCDEPDVNSPKKLFLFQPVSKPILISRMGPR